MSFLTDFLKDSKNINFLDIHYHIEGYNHLSFVSTFVDKNYKKLIWIKARERERERERETNSIRMN